MNIGHEIPRLDRGVVLPEHWNKVADTVNKLRKIQLGPGMKGFVTGSGIALDAIQTPQQERGIFPYGSQWTYGVEFYGSTVRIYNPLFHIAGVTVEDTTYGDFGGVPDTTYLEITPASGDWVVYGTKARTIVALKYDTAATADEAFSLVCGNTLSNVATLPTNDGAGTVDPLRYYLVPLYVIDASYDAETEAVSNLDIYMDKIHGAFSPMLAG